MVIYYTNLFHYKTLKNLPKSGFLVWKFAIWQPCKFQAKTLKILDEKIQVFVIGTKREGIVKKPGPMLWSQFSAIFANFWQKISIILEN
jgi:hypothetical protein